MTKKDFSHVFKGANPLGTSTTDIMSVFSSLYVSVCVVSSACLSVLCVCLSVYVIIIIIKQVMI